MAFSSTSHTADMAAARVLDLRQTAPTVRVGGGLAKWRMVSPRWEPNGDSTAVSGSRVMPSPGNHHLAQGFQARGAKILGLADVDAAAYFQGLVAQAMTVLQQQQSLPLQVLDFNGRFRR